MISKGGNKIWGETLTNAQEATWSRDFDWKLALLELRFLKSEISKRELNHLVSNLEMEED